MLNFDVRVLLEVLQYNPYKRLLFEKLNKCRLENLFILKLLHVLIQHTKFMLIDLYFIILMI